jgi:hypothetical protein
MDLDYENIKNDQILGLYFSNHSTGILNYDEKDKTYLPLGQNCIIYTPESASKFQLEQASNNIASPSNETTTIKVIDHFDNLNDKKDIKNYNKLIILFLILFFILFFILILILFL